jgi:hypothetical protein
MKNWEISQSEKNAAAALPVLCKSESPVSHESHVRGTWIGFVIRKGERRKFSWTYACIVLLSSEPVRVLVVRDSN